MTRSEASGRASSWADRLEEEPSLWAVWAGDHFRLRALPRVEAVRARVSGETVVPDDYADAPSEPSDEVWAIAATALDDLIRLANRDREEDVEYSEMELRSEGGATWTFWRPSPQLQEQGWIPGAAICSVDKLDRRVWVDADFEENARWQREPTR